MRWLTCTFCHRQLAKMRDENADRTRISYWCESCRAAWHCCKAKRLSSEPDMSGNRAAWGLVGVQSVWCDAD